MVKVLGAMELSRVLLRNLIFNFYALLPQERTRAIIRKIRRPLKCIVPPSILFAGISGETLESWLVLAFGLTLPLVAVLLYFVHKKERMLSRLVQAQHMQQERKKRTDIPAPLSWDEYPVSDAVRSAVKIARRDQREFLLGRIDPDGRVMCEYGALPYLPSVAAQDFSKRDRYDIDIVVYDNAVLLRKDYRGNRSECVREWFILEQMAGKARVPIVRGADLQKSLLYMDFISGNTVLEVLRQHGALIRDSDIEDDPAFADLDEETRQRRLDERGTPLLRQCFSELFFKDLDDLVDAVHRCRVADLDLRFANILVDGKGAPWMIDFHEARVFPRWADWIFQVKCDGDYLNYNRVFGRNKLTETTARQLLKKVKPEAWKCAVDFGKGLTRGNVGDRNTGMAYWQSMIAENFPDIRGKRVFVLGGGNGVVPLLVVRSGAKKVVSVEKNKFLYESSVVTQRVFEWRDMRSYALEFRHGDLRSMGACESAEFDIIVAVMSLDHYYHKEIEQLVGTAVLSCATLVIHIDQGELCRKNKLTLEQAAERIMSMMSINHFGSATITARTQRSWLIVGSQQHNGAASRERPAGGHCNKGCEALSFSLRSRNESVVVPCCSTSVARISSGEVQKGKALQDTTLRAT